MLRRFAATIALGSVIGVAGAAPSWAQATGDNVAAEQAAPPPSQDKPADQPAIGDAAEAKPDSSAPPLVQEAASPASPATVDVPPASEAAPSAMPPAAADNSTPDNDKAATAKAEGAASKTSQPPEEAAAEPTAPPASDTASSTPGEPKQSIETATPVATPSEPTAASTAVVAPTEATPAQPTTEAIATPTPHTSPAPQDAATAAPAEPAAEAKPAGQSTVALKTDSMSDEARSIVASVRDRLGQPATDLTDADKADRAALIRFYADRQDAPLWIDGDKLSVKALAAIAEIGRADDWGLAARDFDLPAASENALERVALAAAEMKLSIAALKYARFARGGRIPVPREMSSYLDRDPPVLAPAVVLERIASAHDIQAALIDFQPRHEQFRRLQRKLVEMRNAEKVEDEPVVMPPSGPLLGPGKSHPDVATLRRRLKAGEPPASADGTPGDPTFFDDALAAAVKAYQRDNGMQVDGLVGRRTRANLNSGTTRKVDDGLVIANMEAWRWMPEELGETYVWVNLPEFLVRVVKRGEVIHEERIVAGEVDKQTPVFSHELETVVLHPFWGVPDSIKVRELLPSLARGSSLSRRGLRIQYNGREVNPQSIDWSRADIRNYHVYQPPGDTNVLGEVKFMFPNKHQVYMHDTPSKHLFDASQRTFSHGCMRVRNPMKLAEIVLREDKGWTAETVQTMLRTGPENNNIQLNGKLPVHVTYFTAWVDDAGNLQSRPDIYLHEKRIRLALAGRWNEIPRHRDHLLPVEYVRPQVDYYASNPVEKFFQNVFGGF